MVTRNKNIAKLPGSYLFRTIDKKVNDYKEQNPDAEIIKLGIGDTPGPLTKHITEGLTEAAKSMGTPEGYSGYPDQGDKKLRELINQRFYNSQFSNEEIYISDGSKCDCGRLQMLFGADCTIAVQDPVYPVYVDSAVIMGMTGEYSQEKEQFDNITYLPCTPENDFFPDLEPAKDVDFIYFCSPNNPTGSAASKEQLQKLVDFAHDNKCIIVFDSAYCMYVSDSSIPTSIFEIEGSKEVAIEVNSFSKFASFTGVRLGWTIVPKELHYLDGESVLNDWNRLYNTVFNGTPHITQRGGIAALEDAGWNEAQETTKHFLDNAQLLKSALQEKDLEVYSGEHSPYVWARIPGRTSWETFDYLLEKAQVVCTPGSGFGKSGEGFVRFSAFADRANIEKAITKLKEYL